MTFGVILTHDQIFFQLPSVTTLSWPGNTGDTECTVGGTIHASIYINGQFSVVNPHSSMFFELER